MYKNLKLLCFTVLIAGCMDFTQDDLPRGLIAFASSKDGDAEIYTIYEDGSDLQQLTDNTDEDTQPAWSSDGTLLTFVSDRSGVTSIYTMNTDGSNQRQIKDIPGEYPVWSPDGTKLAFVSWKDNHLVDIFIMNSDGTNPVNITNTPDSLETKPSWIPGSDRLTFISTRDRGPVQNNNPSFDIFSMKFDGSDIQKIKTGGTDLSAIS